MAKGSKRRGEITSKGPDVGAFAHESLKIRVIAIGDRDQPKSGDLHPPWRQDRRLRCSAERIGALPVYLDRRIWWGRLKNGADKTRKNGLDCVLIGPRCAFVRYRSFAIIGRARDPPANAETIRFAAVHCVGSSLGRLAQRDRQHTRSPWIERTRMSSFGPGGPADHVDDPARDEPQWFVNDEPPMKGPLSHRLGSRWRWQSGDRGRHRGLRVRRQFARPDQTHRRA